MIHTPSQGRGARYYSRTHNGVKNVGGQAIQQVLCQTVMHLFENRQRCSSSAPALLVGRHAEGSSKA